jgi:hypothetical protein
MFSNQQRRSYFNQKVRFVVRLGSALEGTGKGIGKVVNSTVRVRRPPRVGPFRAC